MLCRDYPIIIPITDVIKKYNKKIEKLYDEIQQKLLENAELLSLRDFLLPLLMNGQVGFKD
jgi:type I restriction enzyme S subunit